jgi:hypothetical protein
VASRDKIPIHERPKVIVLTRKEVTAISYMVSRTGSLAPSHRRNTAADSFWKEVGDGYPQYLGQQQQLEICHPSTLKLNVGNRISRNVPT